MKKIVLLYVIVALLPALANSQSKKISKKMQGKGAFASGVYPSLFREAGYGKMDIETKVAKAYHDVFEGPNKVYFEVGDSMAYVSDVKNHDARTEGLSYGMMIAVHMSMVKKISSTPGWAKRGIFCLEH
jgi:oligosaccharide reducing-end xylanase